MFLIYFVSECLNRIVNIQNLHKINLESYHIDINKNNNNNNNNNKL